MSRRAVAPNTLRRPRHALRRRRSRSPLVMTLVAVAAVVVAGGCSSGPQAEYSPDAATAEIQRTLGPSPAQVDCLRSRFRDDPSIAAVFNLDTSATDEQRARYLVAVRSCIPVTDFGLLLGTALLDSEPSAAPEVAPCVQGAFAAMDVADQDRLYLYFSHPGAVDADQVVPATNQITDACGLHGALGSAGSDLPAATSAPAG